MRNLSVFGAQWGDEGKGKVVDFYTEQVDVVVRFAGGNNAGHTLVIDGRKLVVHLLPSGVVRPATLCLLTDGMVIDPGALIEEMDALARLGSPLTPERLLISGRAHLVLPYHRLIDELREGTPGAIGTTKRGIGPAYEDKMGRRGLRVGDLLRPDRLASRLAAAHAEAATRIRQLGGEPPRLDDLAQALLQQARRLAPHVSDTASRLWRAMAAGQRVLFEGAQGVMLDIDQGTYPFVTSSTTLAAGACAGAGVPPTSLGELVGVAKAYVTRVGGGPLPTEIFGADAEQLRRAGQEFGATTGRPRRCGWLDLPALRWAVRSGGMRWLALTKLDVLGGRERIPVCEAYELGGARLETLPADPDDLSRVKPVYRELPGFPPLSGDERTFEDLPGGARQYTDLIERELGVGVCLVSTGAGREATIVRRALE